MKLLKTFVFLALFTRATCAPDRLGFKSDTSSGISDESRIGNAASAGNYDNISASDNTAAYYLKRKDVPGLSPLTSGKSSKRSQTTPTKTLRFRRKPKNPSPTPTKKMHLRVKPKRRASVISRDTLSGELKSSTRTKTDLNLYARNAVKNASPTPAPTGEASVLTTVYITDENNFALLLPRKPDGNCNHMLDFLDK